MKFHELSELFPLIEGKDLDDLVEDIRKNGLRQPIMTYKGEILDGRNRFIACEKAKVKPTFVEYKGDKPVNEVISLNLTRRHLDLGQRAIIAAKIANMYHGQNKSSDTPIGVSLVSIPDAAEQLKVSPRAVNRAKTILDDPELVAAVESGAISLSAAANKKKKEKKSKEKLPKAKENFKPKIVKSDTTIRALEIMSDAETLALEAGKIRKELNTLPFTEIDRGGIYEAWITLANEAQKVANLAKGKVELTLVKGN